MVMTTTEDYQHQFLDWLDQNLTVKYSGEIYKTKNPEGLVVAVDDCSLHVAFSGQDDLVIIPAGVAKSSNLAKVASLIHAESKKVAKAILEGDGYLMEIKAGQFRFIWGLDGFDYAIHKFENPDSFGPLNHREAADISHWFRTLSMFQRIIEGQ